MAFCAKKHLLLADIDRKLIKKALSRRLRLISVAAVAFFLLVPNARAASILIDAESLTGSVAFNFGQFEGGFSINGSTPVSTGGSVFGDGTQLNFTGQWIDLGQATAFSRTVYWVEPSAPNLIDDILQWTITPSGGGLATISGFFQSQGLGTLPIGVNPADVIVEQSDGSHNPFIISAPFLLGQVRTDPSATVPEPATLALMGLGLAGLGFARKRKAA